jgi:hypothetical protein
MICQKQYLAAAVRAEAAFDPHSGIRDEPVIPWLAVDPNCRLRHYDDSRIGATAGSLTITTVTVEHCDWIGLSLIADRATGASAGQLLDHVRPPFVELTSSFPSFLGGDLALEPTEQLIRCIAAPLVLLRRHVGHVAEPATWKEKGASRKTPYPVTRVSRWPRLPRHAAEADIICPWAKNLMCRQCRRASRVSKSGGRLIARRNLGGPCVLAGHGPLPNLPP